MTKTRILCVSITSVVLLVTFVFGFVSCRQSEADTGKIVIAVTILPQAEFVEKVGRERVEIVVMVPPSGDPHTYEPTPSQLVALSKAKIYAQVGSGVDFELSWMDNLIAQNKDMLVVDCSQGVQLQEIVESEQHEVEEGEHEGLDPHIWMSPKNVQVMVRNIASGLIQVDSDNREYYEQNRDAYLQELTQIDQDIRQGLSGVKNRLFMVYHPAFGYFASEYGLVMLPIEAEGKEPTPAGLQYLIDQAEAYDIKIIFAEPQFNPQSATVIADAIGGMVVLIDALARDYIDNLRSLLVEMAQAME